MFTNYVIKTMLMYAKKILLPFDKMTAQTIKITTRFKTLKNIFFIGEGR